MAPFTSSESSALAASQRGDRSAYGLLVEKYKHLVCAVTYGTTGDMHASEDLAQETFVAAWTHLDRLRDPSAFRSWLCGIARNVGLTWLRKRQRDVLTKTAALETGRGVADPSPTPREAAIKREHEAVVWHALEKIPEGFRIPLILYYREGRSVEEVAKTLGMSDAAVRQRLHRGREFLRAQVAEVVEASLSRTRPGSGFTAGVLAAIAAIPVGTMAKAGAATVGAGIVKSLLGVLTTRGPLTAGIWASAAGGVAVLLVLLSGWNAGVQSEPEPLADSVTESSSAVEVDTKTSPSPPVEHAKPERDVTEEATPAATAVDPVSAPETSPALKAIVVHPPDSPIHEWDGPLRHTGRKGEIIGQILTLNDEPAGGAEVMFHTWRGPRVAIAGKTRSNADGWFSIDLPPGKYSLAAQWQGMAGIDGGCSAPIVVAEGSTLYTQTRVEPGLSVKGIVVDDATGIPLAGVIVVSSGGQALRTDAAGRFEFKALHRNYDNTLAVVDDAWYCYSHAFAGGTSAVALELRARAAGTIRGRVTGSGGKPMPGVPVKLALSGSGFQLSNCLAITDRHGAYTISGVDTEHSRLPVMARSNGYRQVDGTAWASFDSGSRTAVIDIQLRRDPSAKYEEDVPTFMNAYAGPSDEPVEAVEETAEEVVMPSSEGNWITGSVVDNEGEPLSCVTVVSNEARAMTNAMGEFRLEGLTEDGRIKVRAISRGDTGPGGTLAELQVNRGNQRIVVQTPECEVVGQVLDKVTHKPIQRFWIKISHSTDTSPMDFRVYGEEVLVNSEDGTFQLGDIQAKAGVHGRLTVRADGYSLATVPRVRLHSVGNSGMDSPRIELTASPMPGGFNGVIVDRATGVPLDGARISINEADGVAAGTFPYSFPFSGWDSTVTNFPGSQHATTDAQGVFSFPDWADSKGWVAVECTGYGRYWLHDVPFSTPFRLEMEPQAVLTGSVATPVDPNGLGGGVTIFWMDGNEAIWNECVPINDDGTFYCDRLAPGRYMVHSYGLQIWHKENITLKAGERREIHW
ncbi:MAG: sigma-70 family RNA polymerase sigma factor [Candidatus Hydrogenedentes bacterium]|nr:sigma-70 family RNA polymerase sigma factor [Candidatus Hydrogenedentota bacterium]